MSPRKILSSGIVYISFNMLPEFPKENASSILNSIPFEISSAGSDSDLLKLRSNSLFSGDLTSAGFSGSF